MKKVEEVAKWQSYCVKKLVLLEKVVTIWSPFEGKSHILSTKAIVFYNLVSTHYALPRCLFKNIYLSFGWKEYLESMSY
jgi:hypothetical protein